MSRGDALDRALRRKTRERKPSKFDMAMAAAAKRRGELRDAIAAAFSEYEHVSVEFGTRGQAFADARTGQISSGTVFGYTIRLYEGEAQPPAIEVWVQTEATDAAITELLEKEIARKEGR